MKKMLLAGSLFVLFSFTFVECIYKRSNGFLPYNEFTLNYTE